MGSGSQGSSPRGGKGPGNGPHNVLERTGVKRGALILCFLFLFSVQGKGVF